MYRVGLPVRDTDDLRQQLVATWADRISSKRDVKCSETGNWRTIEKVMKRMRRIFRAFTVSQLMTVECGLEESGPTRLPAVFVGL